MCLQWIPMENLHQPFAVTFVQSRLTDRYQLAPLRFDFNKWQDLCCADCNHFKIYTLSAPNRKL